MCHMIRLATVPECMPAENLAQPDGLDHEPLHHHIITWERWLTSHLVLGKADSPARIKEQVLAR